MKRGKKSKSKRQRVEEGGCRKGGEDGKETEGREEEDLGTRVRRMDKKGGGSTRENEKKGETNKQSPAKLRCDIMTKMKICEKTKSINITRNQRQVDYNKKSLQVTLF